MLPARPRDGVPPLGTNSPATGIEALFMNHFPPLWTNSAEAAGLWQRLRSAPRSLLMLDYDGTLAPFHIDRFAATPYPGVEDRLATLSALARVRLVLVSGRSARELRDLLPPGIRAEIWGSHGREQLKSDGSYELFTLDPSAAGCSGRRWGGRCQRLGFQKHWRLSPPLWPSTGAASSPPRRNGFAPQFESVFDRLAEPDGLHLLPFDGGLELRSTDRTKGTAVGQILAQEPADAPGGLPGRRSHR